jgi:Microtubule-binding calmodulin-regulated spectrin-associated
VNKINSSAFKPEFNPQIIRKSIERTKEFEKNPKNTIQEIIPEENYDLIEYSQEKTSDTRKSIKNNFIVTKSLTLDTEVPISKALEPTTEANELLNQIKENIKNLKLEYLKSESESKVQRKNYLNDLFKALESEVRNITHTDSNFSITVSSIDKINPIEVPDTMPIKSPDTFLVEPDAVPIESNPIPIESNPIPIESNPIPIESNPIPIESKKPNTVPTESNNQTQDTPSFSEKDIYSNFNTFGSIGPRLKPKPDDPEDNHRDIICIQNDTENTRNFKQKKWDDRKSKRIEELEERRIKKNFSPEKVITAEKSPRVSTRPSIKPEIRNSPKPVQKNREELKSSEDKYRRHKNLPDLVYKKPSNRKIIKNAITQLCLAGDPNRVHREEVLNVLNLHKDVNYFIILFSEYTRRDVRGLYKHDVNTSEVSKVFGPGYLPDLLDCSMVVAYFRYDSGAKEFKIIQCKDFITATDAVCLKKVQKVYEN